MPHKCACIAAITATAANLQNFPISESKLIDMAKKLYAEDSGTKSPEALAPAFRFEFPIVSLGKQVSPGASTTGLGLLSRQTWHCPLDDK